MVDMDTRWEGIMEANLELKVYPSYISIGQAKKYRVPSWIINMELSKRKQELSLGSHFQGNQGGSNDTLLERRMETTS